MHRKSGLISMVLLGVVTLYTPSVATSTAVLQRQNALLKEQIDGLTSVVEGLSVTVHRLQEQHRRDMARLKALESKVDHAKKHYVTHATLKKLLGDYTQIPATLSPQHTTKSKHSSTKSTTKQKITDTKHPKSHIKTVKSQNLEALDKKTLYNRGVKLFRQKHYSEAKKYLELAEAKGYHPATSNYYLGEIAYYSKKYNDAIFHYKKSAGLYDKAGYIDTLLLHTAISLEKKGDKEQAKYFYENIIANYPGKKTATIAKKRLKGL